MDPHNFEHLAPDLTVDCFYLFKGKSGGNPASYPSGPLRLPYSEADWVMAATSRFWEAACSTPAFLI